MTEPAAIYRTGIPLRCPLCRQDGLTIAGSVAACPACGLKRQADEHAVFDLSAEVATDEAIQREKYDELLQGGTQASDPLRHFVSPQGLQKVRMLRRLGLRPGQRFLEAGCGAGPLSQAFGQYLGATGVAIDISPASVRAQLARRGQGAHFDALVASATNLPFPDATFDASVALDIAEHMARPEQLYAELARVTKPGGRALLRFPVLDFGSTLEWMKSVLWRDRWLTQMHAVGHFLENFRTKDGHCHMARDAGFQVRSCIGFDIWSDSIFERWLLPRLAPLRPATVAGLAPQTMPTELHLPASMRHRAMRAAVRLLDLPLLPERLLGRMGVGATAWLLLRRN